MVERERERGREVSSPNFLRVSRRFLPLKKWNRAEFFFCLLSLLPSSLFVRRREFSATTIREKRGTQLESSLFLSLFVRLLSLSLRASCGRPLGMAGPGSSRGGSAGGSEGGGGRRTRHGGDGSFCFFFLLYPSSSPLIHASARPAAS